MNKKLAEAMARDNAAEDAGMHGDDRATCWTHQTWVEECADDPIHDPNVPITSKWFRPA